MRKKELTAKWKEAKENFELKHFYCFCNFKLQIYVMEDSMILLYIAAAVKGLLLEMFMILYKNLCNIFSTSQYISFC